MRINTTTRLTPRFKTLIDNIFSTDTANAVIAGNISATLSDHLAQFLLFPIKRTKPESKVNNYCRNFKRFDPKVFLQDLQNINWHTALKLDEENVDNSFDRFFQIIETLLDTYAPIEKLSRKKQKLMLKPWLTKGIMTSVKKRISSIENSSELDVMKKKTVIYNQFKTYRNIINKLTKISKGNHYQKYFHEHKKNMLKTWDGIKSIININKKEKKDINCLKVDDQQATDSFLISNYFNKFFTTIAKKIESKIVQKVFNKDIESQKKLQEPIVYL